MPLDLKEIKRQVREHLLTNHPKLEESEIALVTVLVAAQRAMETDLSETPIRRRNRKTPIPVVRNHGEGETVEHRFAVEGAAEMLLSLPDCCDAPEVANILPLVRECYKAIAPKEELSAGIR